MPQFNIDDIEKRTLNGLKDFQRGLFDTVLNCTRRRRTGNRHLGATAFRLSKTVP